MRWNRSITTIPPLDNPNAKSYHHGLHLTISCKTPGLQNSHSQRRTIWHYAHADFAKASQIISGMHFFLLRMLISNCAVYAGSKHSYLSWKSVYTPKKVLPPRRRNLPWLNKPLVQSMHRRNCLFQKAKRSDIPLHKSKYKRARNRLTSQLRQARQTYFRNLNPSDAKQFWKSVKILNKRDVQGGSLTHDGTLCSSDLVKANSFNDFFCRCFYQPITTTTSSANRDCSPDILCTVDEVCKMLKFLDTSKANGPDGISARMLKSTADAIAPSVTKLFNYSIECCHPPSSCNTTSVVPIPKIPKASSTADYRPISLVP